MGDVWIRWIFVMMCLVPLAVGGCAGPGPDLFPVVPVRLDPQEDGTIHRWYDTDYDGRSDYCEKLDVVGRVVALKYDPDADGTIDQTVELDQVPPEEIRHLVVIADSVPYRMVRDLWLQGRFRYCYPPGRVISPFPVRTDLSLAELFGMSPCPGMESAYFDGENLTDGYAVYVNNENVPWHGGVDYRLEPLAHSLMYLEPAPRFNRELRRIQVKFLAGSQPVYVAYMAGTSSSGSLRGRNGHQDSLIRIDRFCQQMMLHTKGRVRFTLFSDHGHNLVSSRLIPLPQTLRRMGYRVGRTLERPGDIVIPEFGPVTCAGVHTRDPAGVATDVIGIEGIELVAYVNAQDDVVVLSSDGRARVSRTQTGFRYQTDFGDPLLLLPVIEEFEREGRIDSEKSISDEMLFEMTAAHVCPDPVQRLWRAFHGLVVHTPDVLVSVKDGYHCGSPYQTDVVGIMASAHGNLRKPSSYGFTMTMAGQLPELVRMVDLNGALQQLGVHLRNGTDRNVGSSRRQAASELSLR